MAIQVVNKHRDDCTGGEYIGRGSPLGNPFKVKPFGPYERGQSIELYEEWLREKIAGGDPKVCSELNRLWKLEKNGGVTLICFCKPKACHGDVIAQVLSEQL